MFQFIWDAANTEHIARHGITTAEAEQVIFNEPVDLGMELRNAEERTVQVGESNHGRILVVVSTWRAERLRVVTAWPAKARMRKLYELRKQANTTRRTEGEGL